MLTKTSTPTNWPTLSAIRSRRRYAPSLGLALLLLSQSLYAFTCSDATQIPEAQCNSLVALYNNTAGDNWTNNDGWLKNINNCSEQLPLPPPADNSYTNTAAGQVGANGYAGDGGPATAALLNAPKGIAIDKLGNIYIADTDNHRIRKIDNQRNITTLAGDGNPGYRGDDSQASQAQLNSPMDVALDSTGQQLYIADRDNYRIRKLNLTTGIITTVAGTNRKGYTGDGGLATAAKLQSPVSIVLDQYNNIYIADTGRHIIRQVDNNTGIITTLAGKGYPGYRGNHGPASNALLNQPMGLTFDNSGNLYFADHGNNCIRKLEATTGTLTTVAGDTNVGDHGDGGQATLAQLNGPTDVVIDNAGSLYIADYNNHRIRKVDNTGTITTIAGDGNAGYKDSTLATVAQFNNPWSLALDNQGNLVISDTGNHLLRKVGTPLPGLLITKALIINKKILINQLFSVATERSETHLNVDYFR